MSTMMEQFIEEILIMNKILDTLLCMHSENERRRKIINIYRPTLYVYVYVY